MIPFLSLSDYARVLYRYRSNHMPRRDIPGGSKRKPYFYYHGANNT